MLKHHFKISYRNHRRENLVTIRTANNYFLKNHLNRYLKLYNLIIIIIILIIFQRWQYLLLMFIFYFVDE